MNKPFLYLLFVLAFSLSDCGEKINEFSGFTKAQMEYLLSGDSAYVWMRVTRWEDGREIDFTDCQKQNHLIFMTSDNQDIRRLLYTYDTAICDSLTFCDEYPAYCASDTAQCNNDPEFCASLGPDTLFVATWEVTGAVEDDEITDQLLIKFWGFSNVTTVTQISSQSFEWEYEESTPGIGMPVEIKETYQKVK